MQIPKLKKRSDRKPLNISIDAEIEKISDKFMKELNQLKQKKAELLAITDQSAVAV